MMKILHVLCEGQSEQSFVAKVLRPYLLPYDIVARPTLLVTNHKLDARGGMIDYKQVKRDLRNLIQSAKDTAYEKHFFTTMFDLYALPNDFPGFRVNDTDCYGVVRDIEAAFAMDIDCSCFIPYIELHEFETLVLCNLEALKIEYPLASKNIDKLDTEWRKQCQNQAELVNTHWESAPSRRICKALGNMYHYNKPKMAVMTTSAKGIDSLRTDCPHFNQWIEQLTHISV